MGVVLERDKNFRDVLHLVATVPHSRPLPRIVRGRGKCVRAQVSEASERVISCDLSTG